MMKIILRTINGALSQSWSSGRRVSILDAQFFSSSTGWYVSHSKIFTDRGSKAFSNFSRKYDV